MAVDLGAVFAQLNTNTQGDSATILDKDEVNAAKQKGCIFDVEENMNEATFRAKNESNAGKTSIFDTNADSVVQVSEQKEGNATLVGLLKNVWTSAIARFFKDDISYNEGNAQSTDSRVQQRQQNAINFINYAKQNNVDKVFKEVGKIHEYTDDQGNKHTSSTDPSATSEHVNDDGTSTTTYNDGSKVKWSKDTLILEESSTSGNQKYNGKYDYNEDGSYTYRQQYDIGTGFVARYDKYDNITASLRKNKSGSMNIVPQKGQNVDDILNGLGITGVDAQKVKSANPKLMKAGGIFDGKNDLFIPAGVVANMGDNLNEEKLLDYATGAFV